MVAFKIPDTILSKRAESLIEGNLIPFPLIILFILFINNIFLKLMHKLGQSLIQIRLVFVVLCENSLCEGWVVTHEVTQWNYDWMVAVVQGQFALAFVLEYAFLLIKCLDKVRKGLADALG